MTLCKIIHFADNEGESLCNPKVSKDKMLLVIVDAGKIALIQEKSSIFYPYTYLFSDPNITIIKIYAQRYNKNYDYLSSIGYTPTEILIDALYEIKCADCPLRDEC